MQRIIETQCDIMAPKARVWQVLMDFDQYPQWNPFIQSIQGGQGAGDQLNVKIVPPGKKPMTFKPKVLVNQFEKRFEWKGKFLLPGIFDGIHLFSLTPLSETKTQFVQEEIFSGALVPFVFGMMRSAVTQGFEEMNEALKQRCERER